MFHVTVALILSHPETIGYSTLRSSRAVGSASNSGRYAVYACITNVLYTTVHDEPVHENIDKSSSKRHCNIVDILQCFPVPCHDGSMGIVFSKSCSNFSNVGKVHQLGTVFFSLLFDKSGCLTTLFSQLARLLLALLNV